MIQPQSTTSVNSPLRDKYYALRSTKPAARMRDLAKELDVSEGALVAACCGAEAVRLEPRWTEFLPQLPSLGEVMVLTRNEAIVHEKDGKFANINFIGHGMAQVVNHDVDLRIFLRGWKHLFAVEQLSHGRTMLSFQVFDGAGQAVHKIYLRPQSDQAAYQQLVQKFASENQSPEFIVAPPAVPPPFEAKPADQASLHARWKVMKDTHDFYPMIRDFGLTRRQANALIGPEFAVPLPANILEKLLNKAVEQAVPIMVFVGNSGCIQIHTGRVHNIKWMDKWLNVLDPGFNLHVQTDLITEAWLVRKPTVDGIVTSIELFDAKGEELALIFGERKPGRPELETWRTLAENIYTTTEKN